MTLPHQIISAERHLEDLHDIEWQCAMFARQHMHSSERQLRREIARIASNLRIESDDQRLSERQRKIGEALIKVAQKLIAVKHAPIPAKLGKNGVLRLEGELRAKPSGHHRSKVPHLRIKAEQHAPREETPAEKFLKERADHERLIKEKAKELADDPEVAVLSQARALARSDERTLRDYFTAHTSRIQRTSTSASGKPDGLDQGVLMMLVASTLYYAREAEEMRRELNEKHGIIIAGETDQMGRFDTSSLHSEILLAGDMKDESQAWIEVDATSPRDTAMTTVYAACEAYAEQEFKRLMALKRPAKTREIAAVLEAQKNAQLFGGGKAELGREMLVPILQRDLPRTLDALKKTTSEASELKRQINQAEDSRVINQLKVWLRIKLEEVVKLRANYVAGAQKLAQLGNDDMDLANDLDQASGQVGNRTEIQKEIESLPSSRIEPKGQGMNDPITTPASSTTK